MIKKSAKKRVTKSKENKSVVGAKKSAKGNSTKTRSKGTKKKSGSTSLAELIVEGLLEKKAHNITILNLSEIQNRVADIFVICDADSTTHVNAIADSVVEVVKKKMNEKPFHSEGWENGQWILLDYVNVVAHIFMKETREFYDIETLWADAVKTTIE
jgi:ribosome-associated protein